MSRSLFVLMLLGGVASLRAAAPPVSATPGAVRLGSDRLRVGSCNVVVSPNGRLLASGEIGGVCLWDLPSGKVRRRFEYAEFENGVPLAFDPESRWLALTLNHIPLDDSDRKSSVFGLLDIETGKRFTLLERPEPLDFVTQAAFLDRGRAVCCLEQPTQDCRKPYGVHVWALPSRKKLGRIPGVSRFASSPGSDVIVTGRWDGTVRFFRVSDFRELGRVKNPGSIAGLALSPDGKVLASVGDPETEDEKTASTISVWIVESRKRVRVIRQFGQKVADIFFTTNHTLGGVSEEAGLSFFDVRTGRAINPAPIEHRGFSRPAFSEDGTEVVTVGDGGRVEVRRVTQTKPILKLRGTPPHVARVAIADGGRSLVVLGATRSILGGGLDSVGFGWDDFRCGVWDRATGAERHDSPGHRAKIIRVGYSRDGKTLASLDMAGELRLTRQPGGTPHPSFSPKAAGWMMDFRPTPDGKQFCAVTIEGRAEFWDIASGKRVRSVDLLGKTKQDGLGNFVRPFWSSSSGISLGDILAIDSACRVAVLRSSDKFLDVVRLDTGKRTRMPLETRVFEIPYIVLSPDSRYLAASRKIGFVLWDLSSGKTLLDLRVGGSGFAFSPDGRYFAWAKGRDVRLYDLPKRKEAGTLVSGDADFVAWRMQFDDDGQTLAASDYARIIYWDVATKKRRSRGFVRGGGLGEGSWGQSQHRSSPSDRARSSAQRPSRTRPGPCPSATSAPAWASFRNRTCCSAIRVPSPSAPTSV
jgi:WD40 repeat protein